MKKLPYNVRMMIILIMICLFISCEKQNDYSDVVFSNYLSYEINTATAFLKTTSEGSKEGQYNDGSIQMYQTVIDDATLVDENISATQEDVDQAYEALLQAGEDFYDQMVPFRSDFQELIDYAEITLNNTEEGDQEGNVTQGSKAILQDAIDEANQILARTDLIQRMLDEGTTELTASIYAFNTKIIGAGNVYIENPSFELPGYTTTDFNVVPGWVVYGDIEDWAPKAEVYQGGTSLLPLDSVPDGEFVAKIGSYTQGIYQQLPEMIHTNADYTLNFKVAILSNKPDWQGKKYKVIVLSRLISFEREPGDYDFATIISESYDTLGINPAGNVELTQTINIDAVSELAGKKIAIDFIQRHTWNIEDQIWAESFVSIDDVRLYRKLN
jgi:hypothetical protein